LKLLNDLFVRVPGVTDLILLGAVTPFLEAAVTRYFGITHLLAQAIC
jgi:hypothetical protein